MGAPCSQVYVSSKDWRDTLGPAELTEEALQLLVLLQVVRCGLVFQLSLAITHDGVTLVMQLS